MIRAIVLAAAATGFLGLAACEKAGEDIDRAVDKATNGKENKSDGAFEKAGEGIDKATGQKRENPADSLADAVDGDKKTDPK